MRALAAMLLVALAACGSGEGDDDELPLEELTSAERSELVPDWTRYPEMQDGRVDTVGMEATAETGPGDVAGWQVHAVNYAEAHIALTYTFFYTGPDSAVQFAADRQPRLVDDLGNIYAGLEVLDNPRLAIERQSTGLGVYLFRPGLAPDARSLTLEINDSTPPVIRVGPWSTTAAGADTAGARIEARPTGQ